MKKILLINSPVSIYVNNTAFLPLPLLVLRSCLKEIREQGLEFFHEIIDLDLMLKQGLLNDDESFYEQSGDMILERKPDVILFTVHGLNHIVVLKLARIIKDHSPGCITIAGGVGPTLMAGEAIKNCPDIDIIVKGEGEPVLKHLIPAIFENKDFSTIQSIAYRDNGLINENPRHYMDKSDPIGWPDYSLISIEDYMTHNKRHPYIHPGFVPIESGRGCPNACLFCAPAKMWKGHVRYRPVKDVIEEMKFLAAKGGDFSFFTQDNLEEGFLRDLSENLLKENTNIKWGCYARLDRLPEDLAELLSGAGCRMIFTGIETPNREVQKVIRKVINSSTTFTKLQRYNEHGIHLIVSFIGGFENETDEDLNNTMSFAMECATGMELEQLNQFIRKTDQGKLPLKGPNICSIHPLSYMPGTDSFNEEKEKLHISRYSIHPDCYGSYLFSYEQFKDDWTFLGGNPYLNLLPDDMVAYYCSILRLFNFLNSRPFYFALLLSSIGKSPIDAMKDMEMYLDREFVVNARVEEFEARAREYVNMHLGFTPDWTVKKGQYAPVC